jgi:hypothetical protein
VRRRATIGGAIAGGAAATVWAAQQPLDKRLFSSAYDDVELLGTLVGSGPVMRPAGVLIHVANGALFGAAYTQVKSLLPGPPPVRGLIMAEIENFAAWPLGRLTDRFHPRRQQLPRLAGNRRALAQATWRHAVFGVLLGVFEQRLNH